MLLWACTLTQKMVLHASALLHMLFLLPGETTLTLSIWGMSTHLPCPRRYVVSSANPALIYLNEDDLAWPWTLHSFLEVDQICLCFCSSPSIN